MWDLIKEELGKDKKETRNIEINVNGKIYRIQKSYLMSLMIIILALPTIS
jgi:hypothetical protein